MRVIDRVNRRDCYSGGIHGQNFAGGNTPIFLNFLETVFSETWTKKGRYSRVFGVRT